jgi:APA family basic amino acid/polyamine antiporter
MPVDGPARTAPSIRKVGLFTAACVLVSNAVGSGIFTTSGFLARDLGDPAWILLLWAAGGALALAGAMSYAELGASMPRVGGEYVYLRRAFGPLVGFLSGWTSFTIGFGAAIAAAAVGFAHYLLVLLPESGSAWRHGPVALAIALVWLLTGVHALGVERGGSFQRLVTIGKIGALAAIVVAAFTLGNGDWSHFGSAAAKGPTRVGPAAIGLVFVLYSFSGWNAAAYIAGEIRRPERDLPRAMIGGTLFITLLYLAVNAMYFYALPVSELAAEPVLPVAEKAVSALLGPAAATAVTAVLCLSIAGAVSSMIWAGPRVYQAMAQDGEAPRILARTSESGAPVHAIGLQSAWITVLLLSGTFEQLVVYSGFALALFSALPGAGLPVGAAGLHRGVALDRGLRPRRATGRVAAVGRHRPHRRPGLVDLAELEAVAKAGAVEPASSAATIGECSPGRCGAPRRPPSCSWPSAWPRARQRATSATSVPAVSS